MTNPMIRIHDLAINEVTDREMTIAEFKEYEKAAEVRIEKLAEKAANLAAKQAVLDKLGLSAEEVAALLG